MENIHQAIARAKAQTDQRNGSGSRVSKQRADDFGAIREKAASTEIKLDPHYLQSRRIVAYDGKDFRSRPFDVLRTEVLRTMELRGWKILAVTSPTPSCGKTLTATNLALSMARLSEPPVCLVDLDLRKPQVAASLNLHGREGVLDVLEGRTDIGNATIVASVGSSRLQVLPTAPCLDSSDLVASAAMKSFLQDLAAHGQSRITILDLPPLLTGHDTMSILPQVDCVLLVAAVGRSKVSEIEECNRHLQSTEVVRVVLNKVPESATAYAYY